MVERCYPFTPWKDRPTRASKSSNGSPRCCRRCSTPTAYRKPAPGRSSTTPAARSSPSGGCGTRTRKGGCYGPLSRAAGNGRRRKSVKIHPNDDVLEEFVLSLDEEHRSLLGHLAGCSYCRSKLYYLPRPLPLHPKDALGNPKAGIYEAGLAESRRALSEWEAVLAKERDDAPGLFVELFEQPAEDRDLLLRDAPRFQTWGVFELLVERSLESTLQDPVFGEYLGMLALLLSDSLDRKRYGAERIADLQARAWAFVGNARRRRFDHPAAEEAFERAYRQLRKGTRDGLERAIFLDLKASLRSDQRRFDDSLRLLERAMELFLSYGERHRAGRSLVN